MAKKEDESVFQKLPQRHMSDAEKQYLMLLIEKSKLNRERAKLVLDKGLVLFFAFLIFAILAFQNELINRLVFNLLVVASVCILLLSVTPYLNISKKEEEKLDRVIKDFMGE
jgi:hypothetical protein